eukprot:PhF_6_TR22570/c0_g1_i1/m.32138/K09456/aidB; putative acyl-CoA dehydrogenase
MTAKNPYVKKDPRSSISHDVMNQAPPLENYDGIAAYPVLQDYLSAHPSFAEDSLIEYGKHVGSKLALQQAARTQVVLPVLDLHDRFGNRVDQVTYTPEYHNIMSRAMEAGMHYTIDSRKRHTQHTLLSMLHYPLEPGGSCPLTMTYACLPVLEAEYAATGKYHSWVQKIRSNKYDNRDIHISEKAGAMCGMSMTEKQGGSDVRANTTTAVRYSQGDQEGYGDAYLLTGHKWFTSAPMCDGFLTLAYVEGDRDLSCFLVPRWLHNDQRNVGLKFQRLKTKVGDRSNASSEVEYHGAMGYLVGPKGRGTPTIIVMVNHTRLDCLTGSAALMNASVLCAVHNAAHRKAFGNLLIHQPLMKAVLCDLILEVEGSSALALRVAEAFDVHDSPEVDNFRRIAVAISKFYVCKRSVGVVAEALECFGGNGFVEDFPLGRYYRQAPLNGVWEGSGNIMVLDVFRALNQSTVQALMAEVTASGEPELIIKCKESLTALKTITPTARTYVCELAIVLQACALKRFAKVVGTQERVDIFESFMEARVRCGKNGRVYGDIPQGCVRDSFLTRYTNYLKTFSYPS